jgi:hypothetical protein
MGVRFDMGLHKRNFLFMRNLGRDARFCVSTGKLLRLLLLFSVLLTGCSSLPPSQPKDLCAIFEEKSSWYKHANRAKKKWGSSIPTMMSIMYQESGFKHNARPPRMKILWVIPGPRKSDAFGYSQAKDDTWDDYQEKSGNGWSRRDNFADAIDFIGWYNYQSRQRSKIALTDTYNLYLAYHDGHGGFNRGSYKKNNGLKNIARTVEQRAQQYAAQLKVCEDDFKSWWLF